MKSGLIAAICFALSTASFGESYLAIGVETVSYAEYIVDFVAVDTDTGKEYHVNGQSLSWVANPVLLSGAVYQVNAKWSIALDTISTLSADQNPTQEKWLLTLSDAENGQQIDQGEQQNAYSSRISSTQLSAMYQLAKSLSAQTTLEYRNTSFKRYGSSNNVSWMSSYDGLIEEIAGDYTLYLGMRWAQPIRWATWYYDVRALAGVPLYHQVQNTAAQSWNFSALLTGGFDGQLLANVGYQINQNLSLGLVAQGFYRYRFELELENYTGLGNAPIVPQNINYGLRSGISVIWKL